MNCSSNAKTIASLFITFILASLSLDAQDCDCTLEQVINNAVSPCEYSEGTIDTVYTTEELRAFINFVNSNNALAPRTVLIADGTYSIASTGWYPYITASNVIFRSLSGNRDACILTGEGMRSVNPETENGIFAVGDNITIANLTIRDLGNHGIAVTGDNLYIYNVKIQDTYEQMIKGSSDADGVNNGTIKCSYFEYTDGIGPNWYIGGIDLHKATGWNISDNFFINIASPADFVAEHAIHLWEDSANNLVERNQIINCDRGIGFGLGSSPNDGGIIRNNMIYNNGGHPFHDVGIGLETSPNTEVYNNTVHVLFQNAIEFRFEETKGVVITNNLCNKPITSRNGATATLTKNITTATNDWFANVDFGDLRLAGANGNVVDQGSTTVNPTLDIDKTERPQGAGIDIGAHELMQSVSIKELDSKLIQTFSPNPFQNILEITMLEAGEYTLTFFNQNQKEFYTKEVQGNSTQINTKTWIHGIYFCRITSHGNSNKIQWVKLIKMKS